MSRWLAPSFVLATLAACGEPQIIVPDVMTVVALLPTHGSSGVDLGVEPLVYLSHRAASTSQMEASFTLACLGAAVADSCGEPSAAACSSAQPPVVVSYDDAEQVARMVPDSALDGDTCYALTVAAGVEALESDVGPLPVDLTSEFRTR
jgi:hypothetical protein